MDAPEAADVRTPIDPDPRTRARLEDFARDEGLDPARVVGACLRSFLDLSPSARLALLAVDDTGEKTERASVARTVGRAALRAYEGLLDARRAPRLTADGAWDEEAIEAETVRLLCR